MNNNNQLSLSYELLFLLQWLLDHEPERLKGLITYALTHGLKEDLKEGADAADLQTTEELQYTIVDFLKLLESLLQEALTEQAMKTIMEKKLMPAIDQIDNKACDEATVQFSVEKASSRLERNPSANPQEILFNELLKCWKPSKKTMSH